MRDLKKRWSDLVEFHTKGVIFRIENDPITMKLWVFERDHYTRIQKHTKVFPSRKYIFLLETKVLELSRGQSDRGNLW